MEALTCRLLPYEALDGATNMAADEALGRSAADGALSLRFYGWSSATLSLGYFQPSSARNCDPLLACLPWVRRPSGGSALVHHHEITYALALPASHVGGPWMRRMHTIIAQGLTDLGVNVLPFEQVTSSPGEVLCFEQFTPGDLLCAGRKVVGSAQRKYRRCLLQHGSILLATSKHAPLLRGIEELTGIALSGNSVREAVAAAFVKETHWRLESAAWTEDEKRAIEALVAEKYGSPRWNQKR